MFLDIRCVPEGGSSCTRRRCRTCVRSVVFRRLWRCRCTNYCRGRGGCRQTKWSWDHYTCMPFHSLSFVQESSIIRPDMFTPNYTISPILLSNIKRISSLVTQLNSRTYSHIILHKFEREARYLSAHASTSIEGNPLPLTDVKALLKLRPETIRDT